MESTPNLPKINFFVCSTFLDLKEHRAAVIKQLQSKAAVINAQEFFGARDNKPLETCLEEVRRSRVFIIIIGPRYGSIAPDHDKSYSEVEFDEATKLGLPRFAYLIDESADFPIKHVSTGEEAKKLAAFRQRLQDTLTVNTFATKDDLAARVYEDMVRQLPKHGIELGQDVTASADQDAVAILHGFKLLPKLYSGRPLNFIIELRYLQQPSRDECAAHSLRFGASLKLDYKVPKHSLLDKAYDYSMPDLFVEGALAQRLLSIPHGQELNVTVKTSAGEIRKKRAVYMDEVFPGPGNQMAASILMRGTQKLVDYVDEQELFTGFVIQSFEIDH